MRSFDIASLLPIPRLPQYLELVDKELTTTITTDNPFISGPILRLVKAPSKRLRSALLISVVASQSKKIDKKVITACVAVELLHIGSLVHDDLIDHASLRRNIPTINSQEGSSSSIIIGDYLIAKACLEASRINIEIAEKVALAATKLCDGQSLELADQHNVNRQPSAYFKAINGKTAALFAAACEVGGLCARLPDSEVKSLARYGEEFGIVFQVIDDLLDFLSSVDLYGKPIGSDIKEGNYTIPIILALNEQSGKNLKTMLKKTDQLAIPDIINMLLKSSSIKKTVSLMQRHAKLAVSNLDNLNNQDSLNILKKLPETYWEWTSENLITKKYQSTVSSF